MPPKLFHTLCCCIRPSAESYKKNLTDAADVRSDGVVDHYHQGSGPPPQLIDKAGRPLDFGNPRGGSSYQPRTTAGDTGSAGKGGPTPYRPGNGAINNSIRGGIVSTESDHSTNIHIDHSPPPPSSTTQSGVIHQVQQGPPTSRLWPIGGGGKRQKPLAAKSQALPGDFLLPRLHSLDVKKKCLIIDLDETLVHSSFKPVKSADFIIPVEIDNVVHQVYVLKRPHTDEFLERVGKLFECVLFTASLAKYADPVANLLDKKGFLRSRLFREACVFCEGNYVKDLDRLGRDINRIVIMDNSPASYAFHPQNAVPVGTWFDDPNDTELIELLPLMEELARCNNIYEVLERQHQHRLPPGAQMQEQMNQVVPQLPSPSPPPPVVPVTNPQSVGLRAANVYNTIAGTSPSSTTMVGINREQSSTALRPTLVTTTISNSVSTIPITIRHSPMPIGGTFQRRSLNVTVVGPTRTSTDASVNGTEIRR